MIRFYNESRDLRSPYKSTSGVLAPSIVFLVALRVALQGTVRVAIPPLFEFIPGPIPF
jgi:hypothetical protein